jgi:hypothetical protein
VEASGEQQRYDDRLAYAVVQQRSCGVLRRGRVVVEKRAEHTFVGSSGGGDVANTNCQPLNTAGMPRIGRSVRKQDDCEVSCAHRCSPGNPSRLRD